MEAHILRSVRICALPPLNHARQNDEPVSSRGTRSDCPSYPCNLGLRGRTRALSLTRSPPPSSQPNGIDARVTDTDAPTYRGQDPHKVLAKHEKEKKDKYVEHCVARRCHFTPLVFSVDGLRGSEANAATKKLASRLAAKWKRTYSEVCGFVRSRLSITLVKTTSLCLRGARDPTARATHATWDSGVGLALYR